MSVFIDPHSLGPFTGGTYFPNVPKYGSPSFKQVLLKIASLWESDKESLMSSSQDVIRALNQDRLRGDSSFDPDPSLLKKMFGSLSKMYDNEEGGFSTSPKFPSYPILCGLLNYYKEFNDRNALEMFCHTLRKMANGGIYDHLGGGFHRYSVTRDWLVPHFEKMLYDQAHLIVAYLEAYQITKDTFYSNIAKETIHYVLTNLKDKNNNGIYSAQDADSPLPDDTSKTGEGAFYTWKKDEIVEICDPLHLEVFCLRYGIEDNGNVHPSDDPHDEFSNKNILHVSMDLNEIAEATRMSFGDIEEAIESTKKKLLERRNQRPKPQLDDAILTEWNSYMVTSLSKAYQVLNDEMYLKSAKDIVEFLKNEMYDAKTKTLYRTYRNGRGDVEGIAIDYAALISALIDLYESCFEVEYLKWSIELQQEMLRRFFDFDHGGFYHGNPDETMIAKVKEYIENTGPTENSLGVLNLLKLYQFTNNEDYLSDALKTFRYLSSVLESAPVVAPIMSSAIRLYSHQMQIIIAGEKDDKQSRELIETVYSFYEPAKVIILDDYENRKVFGEWDHPMFSSDDLKIEGKPAVYICKNFTCQNPITTRAELMKVLEKA